MPWHRWHCWIPSPVKEFAISAPPLVEMMKERGFYDGAQLRIAHCFAETQAQDLANATLAQFPNARITIEPTTALCSFYAESGGMMIGFEGGYNAENDPEKF